MTTTTTNTERELDALLSESAESARARAAREFARVKTGGVAAPPLALYGAGTLGREVLARLRRAGVEPVAFADDTPEKQGRRVGGVVVMRPREVAEKFPGVVFVVTILNPLLHFRDARARLQTQTGRPAISFLALAWEYPAAFLPYYQFELPAQVLGKAERIRRAFELFEDEESRRQFVAHLRFRLHLDYDALPANSRADYFPGDLLPALPDSTVFVDCGAFDGDTLRRFLAHQRGRFGSVYAFEPDAGNCARLRAHVAALGPDAAERIHVLNAAVGERRGLLRFNATGDMSAAASAGGSVEVEVLTLDETVDPEGRPVYLKFDVEGAEWEALRGGVELVRRARPLQAVSIYHRPDDLWELPIHLRALDPGYKLYLRTQGEDGMDVICYAVPDGFGGAGGGEAAAS